MDPNANLDRALELAKRIMAAYDNCPFDDLIADAPLTKLAGDADELASLIEALNHWITGGGFLPERWERQDDAIKTWAVLDAREKEGPIPGRNEWRRCANALAARRGTRHGQ